MFEETFPQAARPARPMIDKFFKSLQDELMAIRHRSTDPDQPPQPPFDVAIERILTDFFADLFPPIFACIWSMHCHERGYALTRNYSECVSENFDRIEPFGDVPRVLIEKLISTGKSIADGFRFLRDLSSLVDPKQRAIWLQVWNRTSDPASLDPCRVAMFQLNYCPLCSGKMDANATTTRPCRSACQSTVQLCVERQRNGPLSKIDTMLNTAWSGFQRKTQQAAWPNQSLILERVLDEMGLDIQDAITNGFAHAASTISGKVVSMKPVLDRFGQTDTKYFCL